jgi:hypothetical protein
MQTRHESWSRRQWDEWVLRQVGVQDEVWPCRLKGLCHQMMMKTFGILKMLDKVNMLYTLKVWTFGILKMLDKVNMQYTLKVWTFGILKMLDKVNVMNTLKV